jgi:ribosomal protein S18 acetylase RimI-like enzyme
MKWSNQRRRKRLIILTTVAFFVSSFGVSHAFSSASSRLQRKQSSCLEVVETKPPIDVSSQSSSRNPYQPFFAETSIVNENKNEQDSSCIDAKDKNEPATESVAEENEGHNVGSEESNEQESRIERAARAAELLSRRRRGPKRNVHSGKSTSVGSRRVGSASKARDGVGSMTRLANAVRRSAGSNTVEPTKKDYDDNQAPSAGVSKAVIQSTVNGMIKSSSPSMGILGETGPATNLINLNDMQTKPPPGTILVDCPKISGRWKAVDRVSIRTATQSDDFHIANLRLSVFSNFSPNMRQAFCSRSCHVLATRRNQGATCIVATVPRYGSILSSSQDIILGSAECSIHEFYDTTLGSRRHQNSILYITEVAVSPTARKKGIGGKIMQSIDELAKIRGVETLYLHVDVENSNALSLYDRAGFQKVSPSSQLFNEFTKSLNLHDGAMKGRNHFLLYKDILSPTWLPSRVIEESERQWGPLGIEVTV